MGSPIIKSAIGFFAALIALMSLTGLWKLFISEPPNQVGYLIWVIYAFSIPSAIFWFLMIERAIGQYLGWLFDVAPPPLNPLYRRFASFGLPGVIWLPRSAVQDAGQNTAPSFRSILKWMPVVTVSGALAFDGIMQVITGQRIVPPALLTNFSTLLGWCLFLGVFVPFLETLMMAATLEIGMRLLQYWIVLAAISAALWGLLHAFQNHPAQFFSAAWMFFVWSGFYIKSRKAISFVRAVALSFAFHMMNNVISLFLIALSQGLRAAA